MSEKPILYMRAMSPGCRSVLMCAAELGIELEQKIVDLAAGENKKASFIQVCTTFYLYFAIRRRKENVFPAECGFTDTLFRHKMWLN